MKQFEQWKNDVANADLFSALAQESKKSIDDLMKSIDELKPEDGKQLDIKSLRDELDRLIAAATESAVEEALPEGDTKEELITSATEHASEEAQARTAFEERRNTLFATVIETAGTRTRTQVIF